MTTLYKPSGSISLASETSKQQIRLGIQGYPGTGKSWSMTTFPNLIVCDTDRGLGAHAGNDTILVEQLWKTDRVDLLKDKLIAWLEREAMKLTNQQTLGFDSLSATENIFHAWFKFNENRLAVTANGERNKFVEWDLKEKFFNEIFTLFRSFQCDIVMLCHEVDQQDKSTSPGQPGGYSGKIRPLMTGKVKDSMIKNFTDWFRQLSGQKPDEKELTPEALANWKMTKEEFKAMLNTFPGSTFYYWQTMGDNTFDAKASSLVNPPKFMPATFSAFAKYMRKPVTTT